MMPSDLPQIVEIHLKGFSSFFLTFLGHDFLSLLYKCIENDPEGIVLVACSDKQIEGFVAGVIRQSAFYERLIKRKKWSFAGAAVWALIRRPKIAPRLLRALKRPQESQSASAEACLMSISVRPESAGQRIGELLIEAFCQELRKRGSPAVCVMTDRDNNDRVNHFYQRLGFILSRSYITPEGRGMNEYYMSLM
jgi:ribosomal protein S18 acetylase RimI-like enzyme